MTNRFDSLIKKHADENFLDFNLIKAIISHESNFNIWAVRYEPNWRYFYFPREHASQLNITEMTETKLQQCSWGLGQLMGSVARELGFNEELNKLCIPSVNLNLMCLKIKKLYQKYGVESDVISAYNQGVPKKTTGGMYLNQKNYVDPISSKLVELRKLK